MFTNEEIPNKLQKCNNGHLHFINQKECPYCEKLKGFQIPERELNLDDTRSYIRDNIDFRNIVMQYKKLNEDYGQYDAPVYFSKLMRYLDNWLIKGGWGYSKEDAIVIDTTNHLEGISLEYDISSLRIHLELFYTRQRGNRFYDIQQKSSIQRVKNEGQEQEQSFDVLNFHHTCLHQTDYIELAEEMRLFQSNPSAYDTDKFLLEHNKKRIQKMYHVKSEIWFDISAFCTRPLFGGFCNPKK
jgi:hypothetical protein